MDLFDLSSSQKMLLFSEINNPHNDSFYLKFRKDYDLEDLENVKFAIETISKNYLNLQIRNDDSGDFKQYYADGDVNVETFEVSGNVDEFIKDYLDRPFGDIFDSPLYKWAVLKTELSCVLIGVVQHILLDGTSLYSIVPQQIEKCIECVKNNEEYVPIDYSYETYVNAELEYLNSDEAGADKKYWLDTLKEMLVNIINTNENVDAIDVIVRDNDEDILISIKDTGVDFNPVAENDNLQFDNIGVLNKIAYKIDYSRVLGLNSTVITIKN